MARVLEHDGKRLLRELGITTPKGLIVVSPSEARAAADKLGGAVALKAPLPIGGRGKRGAIRLARSSGEVEGLAEELLGRQFEGYAVDRLLVEELVDISEELYLSILFDSLERAPVLVLGRQGGVDVEAAAEHEGGTSFRRIRIDWHSGLDVEGLRRALRDLQIPDWEGIHESVLVVAEACLQGFRRFDATLLEINPLVITSKGDIVAVDVKIDVDDRALFRQQDVSSLVDLASGKFGRAPTELERAIVAQDASESGSLKFIEYSEGDIGFLVSGGGGSLYVTDRLVAHGLRPANYIDFSGPSNTLLRMAYRGVLMRPGLKAVLAGIPRVNITRVDGLVEQLAEVVRECRDQGRHIPVVARYAGAGEDEARHFVEGLEDFYFFGQESSWETVIRHLASVVAREANG